jgi:septal ring factor EnvC (AmiA/AmiB activator)
MKEELQKQFEGVNAELKQARVQKRQIEEELARVVRAIADGQPSEIAKRPVSPRE